MAANRKGNQTLTLFRRSVAPQQYSVSEAITRAIIGSDYDNIKANTSAIKTYTANVLLDTKKITLALQSSDVIGVLPGTDTER